ncbi:sarcosine oxidase subunit gamma family protein [Bartonella sp. LJL80]
MLQQSLPMDHANRDARFGPSLKLGLLTDVARFSLRIDSKDLAAASKTFGVKLPKKIGDMAMQGTRTALCVGPDEWFLLADISEIDDIEAAFAELYQKTIHSLVDVSHREVSIIIEGEKAAYLLQAAIAFDIDKMPVGTGCRTLIDKSQIILLHDDENAFRIEVWNSYVGHVWHLLNVVGKEIELDI